MCDRSFLSVSILSMCAAICSAAPLLSAPAELPGQAAQRSTQFDTSSVPTDEQILAAITAIQDDYIRMVDENFREALNGRHTIVERHLAHLDLAQLNGPQVSMLANYVDQHPRSQKVLDYARSLKRLAPEPTVYGAIACIELVMNSHRLDDVTREDALQQLFAHPALAQAMNSRHLPSFLRISMGFQPDDFRRHMDDIERALLSINPPAVATDLNRSVIARTLAQMDEPSIASEIRTQRRRIHAHLLNIARRILADYAIPNNELHVPERRARFFAARETVEYLESPASLGSLIDITAPEIEFLRVRGPDAPALALSDYRGKVVVLDFWATWCLPCIAGFPRFSRLQEHYRGHDVVIIGVTSIQGYHVPAADREVVRLPDQPEREMDLMDEFMREHDVTWNIAFSSRSVLDPRFDVDALPHLTIIDVDGNVRQNKLNPEGPSFEELLDMIDGLLHEADRPVPAREASVRNG